jgi:rubrerythrin
VIEMLHEKIVGVLNSLIQLDYDAIQAYDRAIAKISNEAVKRDLESFRRDHERHILDLSECVRGLGGVPEELGRDFKGVLLEGLTALRSVTGTVGALKAMRTNEEITNRLYDQALQTALPGNVRKVLERNRDDERRHLSYIERALVQPAVPRRPLESNPRF